MKRFTSSCQSTFILWWVKNYFTVIVKINMPLENVNVTIQ